MPRAVAALALLVTGSLVAHDANQVLLEVSNRGGFGLASGPSDPGNFPRGTPNRYLFGAGLWVGGIGDVEPDGRPDTLTTIGYNPENPAEIEWVEGAVGVGRDDPRVRVLDSTNPADAGLFPATPVAAQELFTVYGDRFSVPSSVGPSIPLGVEVRQRSFAFTEPGLDTAILFQWDLLNISDRIRPTGYAIRELWTGIVLDPDIGIPQDDTAASLVVDGQPVLLLWDTDFSEAGFLGRPGFLAIVPLVNPGGRTTFSQLTSGPAPGVRFVPRTDQSQYRTLAGLAPNTPTVREPGFDLRALIGWGAVDLEPGAVHRTAAAFVWAEASGTPPAVLSPLDPTLTADNPLLAGLVAAVRAARAAYATRLAGLPALLDFPPVGGEPPPGEGDALLQNFPNPFAQETRIEGRLAEAGSIRLEVFDLAGRMVVSLASGTRDAGGFSVVWDGRSTTGREAPAGLYVIRLITPRGTATVRALKVP